MIEVNIPPQKRFLQGRYSLKSWFKYTVLESFKFRACIDWI